MKAGLGIDTGGTYTDAVIYDFDSGEILAKAKSLTTKENLTRGIIGSLEGLPQDMLKQIQLVSLSTTLATNACVEGKGSRGKLILLGYDKELYTKLRAQYGLPDIKEVLLLDGGHGQQGQVLSEPDWSSLERHVSTMDHGTDAYGVVEYWGIRNPAFEQRAKDLIRLWTQKPVVCAHELSTELNSLRRASSTLLNARLITLIDQLLTAVKEGMAQKGIHAPIMVVKGDGTMMSEGFAKEHPVETLLSGPAASVVGGMKVTGCKDALILDIGGTTSDLAVIRDGFTILSEEGVDVGGWKTGTKAIKIQTIGLGGDSILTFDQNEEIVIGPRKAAPLAWMGQLYPHVKEKLNAIHAENKWHTYSLAEFFYLILPPSEHFQMNEEEGRIISALELGPKSLMELAEEVKGSPFFLKTDRLEGHGIIGRSALTPTDLMHCSGVYQAWDTESALLGVEIMAHRLKMPVQEYMDAIQQGIQHRLYNLIVEFLLTRNRKASAPPLSKETKALFDIGFTKPYEEIQLQFSSPLPIIGIGAPAHIFLDRVAQALGSEVLISKDAGVANALGAITGSIIGEVSVLIRPRYSITGISGYGCHGSNAYFESETFDEALEWAKKTAADFAAAQVQSMGASDYTIELHIHNSHFSSSEIELFMETVVTARGIGSQSIFTDNTRA